MLPMKIPGRGISSAAKNIGAAAKPAKKLDPKMKILKDKMNSVPKQKNQMPLEKLKSMPLKKNLPDKMPLKKIPAGGKQPEWMKKDYKPGSIMRGYTKYA